MAAELSTLASSFLDTKPETYAPFFLECAHSKQYLSREVSIFHVALLWLSFLKGYLVFHVPRAIQLYPLFRLPPFQLHIYLTSKVPSFYLNFTFRKFQIAGLARSIPSLIQRLTGNFGDFTISSLLTCHYIIHVSCIYCVPPGTFSGFM